MDIIRRIEDRSSIRKFQDKTVPKEIIEKILELATKAPSGKNSQPWRFIVLQNSKKDGLVSIVRCSLNQYSKQTKPTGSFELGTLWICDIFHCDKEICSWLNRKDELVAAVAIGY